jgi:hypothetical protein
MGAEFECSREVVLPASPDEVWEAVSTAAGNAAWLFPTEIARDDATAWDPPNHFAVRMERGDWFNALEYTIEGREGGTSRLRYVHSGIFVEDWDSQYDAVQKHTDFYLHTLGQYLEHFRGRPATYVGDVPGGIQGPPGSATPDGFERFLRALGLVAPAREGDLVRLTPRGLPPIEGVVDYRQPDFVGVRTSDELYCLFGRNVFGAPVGLSIHSFIAGIDAERSKQDWQRWLNTTLAHA